MRGRNAFPWLDVGDGTGPPSERGLVERKATPC